MAKDVPINGHALTFKQIAEKEGLTEQGVHMAYQSGMYKLRKNKKKFIFLLELHHELDKKRTDYADDYRILR